MAWRIVKQPNGLLARFSDIVDDFTHMNMTEAEAFEVCREYLGIEDAKRKVLAGVQDWKPWTNSVFGDGLSRWNDCIASIKNVHGKKAAEHRLHLTIGTPRQKGESKRKTSTVKAVGFPIASKAHRWASSWRKE